MAVMARKKSMSDEAYLRERENANKRYNSWRKRNPEKAREKDRRYRKKHPEKIKAKAKRNYDAHKDKVIKRVKDWYGKNPEKQTAKNQNRRSANGKITHQEWKEVLEKYGNKCLYPGCERTDITLDHVVPLSVGGSGGKDNVQPLCGFHNSSKGTNTIDYRSK
jgi:hypothetical protein